ncbi:MAG: phosphodiester glycosidase family protein [Deltaproteobacteria bacterium]|nr:phosphodiester glycosidase family protein [Deltaproteobacteria bacterium]
MLGGDCDSHQWLRRPAHSGRSIGENLDETLARPLQRLPATRGMRKDPSRPTGIPVPLLALVAALAIPSRAVARDTWSTPHPGVRQLERSTSAPLRVYALEVDLCHEGVSARATASDERRRTVSSFADLVGADAAINGDFFSYESYGTSGLSVGRGERWGDTADTNGSGFLAFGRGRAMVSRAGDVVDPPASWMREVVSGHPTIVRGGERVDNGGDLCTARHPRTAGGLSEDGRTLILAVVDGRSDQSRGMTCGELGDLMVELGAWEATNLDGGGSSTMWVAGNGVLNDPSDGSQRTVANHLAIIAAGREDPGSCDRSWEEAAVHSDSWGSRTTSDVDGDGDADVCARSSAGIVCALSLADGSTATIAGPALGDDTGWADPANYATLRMGDVDGDGRADLCARADAGVRCWLSDGAGFPTQIEGPAFSDQNGWAQPRYYGTLRLADVDGDGKDDLCARSASDFRCHPSTGTGFAEPITAGDLSDGAGWGDPSRYGTIRMGDIDGDGLSDLCARSAGGMSCWRSSGDGFGAAIAGPAWSDESGWSAIQYWSTIRLADVDGDGRADLCARAAAGWRCHLSNGEGFGEAIAGPGWSDDTGWADYENYSTIRLLDIDGDGALDVCARAEAGIRCFLWGPEGFATPVTGPGLSNESGWNRIRYYSTIRGSDVNGDGLEDICARAAAGLRCWLSDGAGFPTEVAGPAWSDANGWDGSPTFETIRAGRAPPPCADEEECNAIDDDCDGEIDEGCDVPGRDAGAAPDADPGFGSDGGREPAPGGLAGCSCRSGGGALLPSWAWLPIALFIAVRRRSGA